MAQSQYPEAIASILQRVVKVDRELQEAIDLCKLQSAWTAVAGELAQHTAVAELKNKTMLLETESPAWAQQLTFFKQQILDKYKALLPQIQIKDVKTRIARLSPVQVKVKAVANALTAEELAAVAAESVDFAQAPSIKNFLEKLLKKNKLIVRQDKRQACPACGTRLAGPSKICFKCAAKDQGSVEQTILVYLQEAPWSRFADLAKDIPSITETTYHQVKERLVKEIQDQVFRNCFEQQKTSQKHTLGQFKQLALKLVMLRSGLTPDKINDKIIQETLGNRAYKTIFVSRHSQPGGRK